jgi:hypothetical protein
MAAQNSRPHRLAPPLTPQSDGSTLSQLLALSDDLLSQIDIGIANLASAEGLPGIEELDLARYCDWLDEAARLVRLETDRHYYKFLAQPEAFENSQARFVSVL